MRNHLKSGRLIGWSLLLSTTLFPTVGMASALGGNTWPCGIVPLQFEDEANPNPGYHAFFWKAANIWQTFAAGVHFVEIPYGSALPQNYLLVHFLPPPQLSKGDNIDAVPHASVGMTQGAAYVYQSEFDGTQMWSNVHELGHVLGLIHEHQRSDRDDFVTVDQILQNPAQNPRLYNQYTTSPTFYFTPDYDFDSIMHYPLGLQPQPPLPVTGSMNPTPAGLSRIMAQNLTVGGVGQRSHLSNLDGQGMNSIYQPLLLSDPDSCQVTVTAPSLTIDLSSNAREQLSASVQGNDMNPGPITDFFWSTDKSTCSDCVMVATDGTVTGLTVGSAKITASFLPESGLNDAQRNNLGSISGAVTITVICSSGNCGSGGGGDDSSSGLPVNVVTSLDPNDKAGSQGTGQARFISGATPLRYIVSFGNEPTATAPAQMVTITDQLDITNDDLSSLKLGPITFPNHVVSPPPGPNDFSTTVDLRPASNLLVAVHTHLDQGTGSLNWTFQSLDPTTNQPPSDPTAGLLAPGADGSTFFTVMPKQGLPTNTQVQNQASIVFDVNAPIATPTWLNTLDNTPPTSSVQPLPSTAPAASFTVTWSGTDVGAGVQDYTIYVSDNGTAFTAWQQNTTATSATYTGQVGHTYGFYSIARDLVGNIEPAKTNAEATTMVSLITPTVTFTGAPPTAAYNTSFTVAATTNASTTAVITASGACSIVGNTVTMTSGTGTCNLTASWAADSTYLAATATQSTQAVNGPLASLSPANVSFGNVYLGLPAVQTVTLTNTGNVSLVLTSVKVSGGNDSDDFKALPLCPPNLAAGKSCQIIVTFVADGDNYSPTATLGVTDNAFGSPQSVPLSATVINPKASLSSYSLNFGKQKVGTTSPAKTVTLSNTGTTSLSLNTLSVSGTFAFATGTTCTNGSTVAAGTSCVIRVDFTPTAKGTRFGSVTIKDNALLKEQIILLSGTGN